MAVPTTERKHQLTMLPPSSEKVKNLPNNFKEILNFLNPGKSARPGLIAVPVLLAVSPMLPNHQQNGVFTLCLLLGNP